MVNYMGFKTIRYLSLITQVGIVMAVPIFGMVFLGNWLDKLVGAHGIILILCILAGVYMSFRNLYNIAMKSIDNGKKDSRR